MHANRYIDEPSSCPATPRRPGRAVRGAPRLSARPCQRADVRGPVHAVARGVAPDARPAREQALHRRDGALFELGPNPTLMSPAAKSPCTAGTAIDAK